MDQEPSTWLCTCECCPCCHSSCSLPWWLHKLIRDTEASSIRAHDMPTSHALIIGLSHASPKHALFVCLQCLLAPCLKHKSYILRPLTLSCAHHAATIVLCVLCVCVCLWWKSSSIARRIQKRTHTHTHTHGLWESPKAMLCVFGHVYVCECRVEGDLLFRSCLVEYRVNKPEALLRVGECVAPSLSDHQEPRYGCYATSLYPGGGVLKRPN